MRIYIKDLPRIYISFIINKTANSTFITGVALNSVIKHSEDKKPNKEPSNKLISNKLS